MVQHTFVIGQWVHASRVPTVLVRLLVTWEKTLPIAAQRKFRQASQEGSWLGAVYRAPDAVSVDG
jgi:hypothetical protein